MNKCDGLDYSRRFRFGRDAVTIKEQVDTTDKAGQPISVPTAIPKGTGVRCGIIDSKGSEYKRAEQIEAGVDYVVQMRYRSDILPTYELEVTKGKHLGKTLDVVSVIYEPPAGRPREVHLHCKYKAS